MTTTMNSAIEAYRQALNGRDQAAYVACFTEDAVLLDPYGPRALEGVDGLQRFFKGFEQTWATFTMTFAEPHSSGDRVAVAWSVTAVAHNGHDAAFSGINVFTVNADGKISRLEGYWDVRAMLAQIR